MSSWSTSSGAASAVRWARISPRVTGQETRGWHVKCRTEGAERRARGAQMVASRGHHLRPAPCDPRPMLIQDLWYKNAVVYCANVETFMDTNGDGIGDFEGLMRRLDYLAGLGVTCLWLLPFYPSPRRDDGYD